MKDAVDVAIIGTGISGAHCAYQLNLTHPHLRVEVYEASKGPGGRVVNQDGPSSERVVAPSLQPRTRDLLAMLRIPTRRTSQLCDTNNLYFSEKDWYKYRREEFRVGNSHEGPHPRDLVNRALSAYYATGRTQEHAAEDPELLSMSLSDFFRKYGGMSDFEIGEVLAYSGFDTFSDEVSAACYVLQEHIYRAEHSAFETIDGGADRACEKMLLESKCQVFYGYALKNVEPYGRGLSRLIFSVPEEGKGGDTATVFARKVILAMPPDALRKLDVDWSAKRKEALDSVVDVPCFQALLRWKSPWWVELGHQCNKSTTDLPIRQVYYAAPSLLMVYNTGKYAEAWQTILTTKDIGYDSEKETMQKIVDNIRDMHGTELKIDPPNDRYFQFWPAGLHRWRIGAEISRQLAYATDGGSDGSEIYLCSDAFSCQPGWIEGAIESSVRVLSLMGLASAGPKTSQFPADQLRIVEEVDIAVVGLGPAGSYCLERLRERLPMLAVKGYELADRVGGRCAPFAAPDLTDCPSDFEHVNEGRPTHGERRTSEFEELGGSRLLIGHKRVKKLARAYGLATQVPRYSQQHSYDLLVTNGECIHRSEAKVGRMRPVREFMAEAVKFGTDLLAARKPVGTVTDLFRAAGATDVDMQTIRAYAGEDHILDEEARVETLLKKPESYFARLFEVPSLLQATQNAAFYAVTVTRPTAAEAADAEAADNDDSDQESKKQFTRSKSKDVSVEDVQVKEDSSILIEGYQRLCRNLVAKSKASIRLGHRCEQLQQGGDGKVLLHFPANATLVVAKKVVLCGTISSVLEIAERSPHFFDSNRIAGLQAVKPIPVFKAKLTWASPWWTRLGHTGGRSLTDRPLRQVWYYNDEALIVHCSGAAAEYWHDVLVANGEAALNAALVAELEALHAAAPNAPKGFHVPPPENVVHVYWPTGAHRWVDEHDLELLQGLGSPVLIAGDAFSSQQDWVEGALESVDRLFKGRAFDSTALETEEHAAHRVQRRRSWWDGSPPASPR